MAFSSAQVSGEILGAGDGIGTNFPGTVDNTPVRPGTFKVTATVGGNPVTGEANNNGDILGVGVSGTITTAGVFNVDFTAAPDAATNVIAEYQVNLEAQPDITAIGTELVAKTVRAIPFALKGTVGLLKSFQLRKRFGSIAEDELAIDLTNIMNDEIFGQIVKQMVAAAMGNTNFALTPGSGVSDRDHRESLKFQLAAAESVIVGNAARGTRSFYVFGRQLAEIASTVPGFVKLFNGTSVSGGHLYGTLDGIPVVRIPADTTTLASTAGIVGYKGLSAFEAPIAYSPYMPLTVTSLLPTPNPLVQQRAAAVWAASTVLVPEFLTNFTLLP